MKLAAFLVTAAAVVLATSTSEPALGGAPTATVVRSSNSVDLLAVDRVGRLDELLGRPHSNRAELELSHDEGVSWHPMHTFGQPSNWRVHAVYVVPSGPRAGRLIALVANGVIKPYVSDDGGRTWSRSTSADGGPWQFPANDGGAYTVLHNRGLAINDDYLFMASYTYAAGDYQRLYVWRSPIGDAGNDWEIAPAFREGGQLARPFAKHLHGMASYGHRVFVWAGDDPSRPLADYPGSGSGIRYSDDDGATWQTGCILDETWNGIGHDACDAVDVAFDAEGRLVWAEDFGNGPTRIRRLSQETWQLEDLGPFGALQSRSAWAVGPEEFLLGETKDTEDGGGSYQSQFDAIALRYVNTATGETEVVASRSVGAGSLTVSILGEVAGDGVGRTFAVSMGGGTWLVRLEGLGDGDPTRTAPPATQCANGLDDDGDGAIDAADPDCLGTEDDDEGGPPASEPTGVTTGFEEDPTGAWLSRGSGCRNDWSTSAAHTGERGLRSTASTSVQCRWLTAAPIPVTPGARYTLGAWVSTSSLPGGVRLAVVWLDGDGNYVGGPTSPALKGTKPWTRVSLTAAAPPRAATARLELRANAPGTADWDDVSFAPE